MWSCTPDRKRYALRTPGRQPDRTLFESVSRRSTSRLSTVRKPHDRNARRIDLSMFGEELERAVCVDDSVQTAGSRLIGLGLYDATAGPAVDSKRRDSYLVKFLGPLIDRRARATHSTGSMEEHNRRKFLRPNLGQP